MSIDAIASLSRLPERASSRRRGAGETTSLAPSDAWVDVDVNQRRIPIPTQALRAAASALRSASGGYVDSADCASVVALVLSAMEAHGLVEFCDA